MTMIPHPPMTSVPSGVTIKDSGATQVGQGNPLIKNAEPDKDPISIPNLPDTNNY